MWILSFSRVPELQIWKRWCPWRQMPFPICWGWRTDQQEVEERWCERISCDIEGVYAVGLCVLRLLLVKVYSTWTWKIGIKSHRQMLQRHMAPDQNSGKKGSIAKIQKSAPLERSFLRAGIKGKITWGDVAPRKMRPQFIVVYGENIQKLKNSDNITFNIFGDVKGMPAPTTSKRPDEQEFGVDSTRMLLLVGQRSRATIDPKNGKRIFCKTDSFVPLVVPGLSVNSGSSSSSATLPQESLEPDAHTSPRGTGLHQVHLRIRF